jgi:small ligand-binding sensory domain FIST
MRWASAVSTEHDLGPAVAELIARLGHELARVEPDLVLAFGCGHDAAELAALPGLLRPWLGDGLLIGSAATGIIAGGRELEDGPAVGLLAGLLTDVDLHAVHVEQAALPPLNASRESWWRLIGLDPECEPCFLVVADPFSFDVEHCVRGLDRAFPGATVVGGLSSAAAQPGQACLLAGRDLYSSGALVLAMSGNIRLDAVVAQGCRPVGEPLFVTAAEDNRISELDGRAPREVIGDLFSSLDERDREIFNDRQLYIGLALPGPRQTVGAGDFLVREVVGLDADSGELVIGDRAHRNGIVQFQLRDPESSAADLQHELDRHRAQDPSRPAAALMFACIGRGTGFYGMPDRDSGLFRRAFGDVPLGGMFCAGEVGPVQGATFLHGYTTLFGLLRPRRP